MARKKYLPDKMYKMNQQRENFMIMFSQRMRFQLKTHYFKKKIVWLIRNDLKLM